MSYTNIQLHNRLGADQFTGEKLSYRSRTMERVLVCQQTN